MMENKYLVKVCALLKAPTNGKRTDQPKTPYKTHPVKKTTGVKALSKLNKKHSKRRNKV